MAIDSKAFDGVHMPTYPRLMKRRIDGAVAIWRSSHSGVVLWHENPGCIGNEFADGKGNLDWDVFTGTLTMRNT